MTRWILCSLLFPLVACGTTAEPSADAGGGDAGSADTGPSGDGGSQAPDAGPVRSVEVGTGVTMFEAVTEGQVLPLVAGPQGGGRQFGFDIAFGTRTRGYNPRGMMIAYQLLLASDRSVQATQSLVFDLVKSGDAYSIFGSAPQIMDCCNVRNQDLIMRVEITDADGLTGSDERRVHGGPTCRDPASGTELCP